VALPEKEAGWAILPSMSLLHNNTKITLSYTFNTEKIYKNHTFDMVNQAKFCIFDTLML